MNLTARKQAVLQAVIHEHIVSTLPVGSKILVERYGFGVSSATVRNDMAELEEEGYLRQPHTSAGRIPTDKGYRFFVDTLAHARMMTRAEQERIKRQYESVNHEIEDLLQETTRIVSALTGLASVVVAPNLDNSVLRCVEMVPLSSSKVLMVLVTSAGLLENRVLDVPIILNPLELRHVCGRINEKLRGLRLAVARQRLLQEGLEEVGKHRRFFDEVLMLIQHILDARGHERVYLEGVSNMVAQPEFHDVQDLRRVLLALEGQETTDILSVPDNDDIVRITIGSENRARGLNCCSVVSARYCVEEGMSGSISIVGPTRMDYSSVIEKLRFVADNLSSMICDIVRE